MGSKKREKRVK